MHILNLPMTGGKLAPYAMRAPRNLPAAHPPFNRIAYAAAHVVADPLAEADPWLDAAIDWDRTVAFRRHLWALGLGVAECPSGDFLIPSNHLDSMDAFLILDSRRGLRCGRTRTGRSTTAIT